jgi:hypothetical protein
MPIECNTRQNNDGSWEAEWRGIVCEGDTMWEAINAVAREIKARRKGKTANNTWPKPVGVNKDVS